MDYDLVKKKKGYTTDSRINCSPLLDSGLVQICRYTYCKYNPLLFVLRVNSQRYSLRKTQVYAIYPLGKVNDLRIPP